MIDEPTAEPGFDSDVAWWRYHYGVDNRQEWDARLAAVRDRNRPDAA